MYNVLSFDPEKVEILEGHDGKIIVRKKTTEKEYQNITLARQHLLNHRLVLDCVKGESVSISVAEVCGWEQESGILTTTFCSGDNLEEILKNSFNVKGGFDWIEILRKIFNIFRSSGFLWGDFAPRNMIWDWPQKTLWLVDFERNLRLIDHPVEQEVFTRYVRNYSREEFSCFLDTEEQFTLFRGLIEESNEGFVQIDQIASKRKKLLLKNLFEKKELYSMGELRQAEDIMVFVATPFCVNETSFFPMDLLDQIGNKGGPNEYVNAIMAVRNLEKNERFSELSRRAKCF